ncbi:RING-9 protein [Dendryphion nanum]|uniref:RING-type E3 ubiquitin transferase n=1 Tax=Dendryphion nanum TaxID=256645 RepID=A0A9P9DVP7_9PLEO|nr:RING-9 protein [Dendryphion nanum]
MRPLRLLLSFATSLLGITLLLFVVIGSSDPEENHDNQKSATQGRLKTSWSFTSPGSLFPPSAIISLTDDNSTFFLARPAAFGPVLPKNGLSGPIWIGSGFGEETMGRGELGCSDVPGWNEDSSIPSMKPSSLFKSVPANSEGSINHDEDELYITRAREYSSDETDAPRSSNAQSRHTSEHADIGLIQESAEITGKVVLLKRGGCAFSEKVLWAQRRGATALIVGDDVRGGPLIRMYASGDASNVSIPSIFTSHTTAQLLSSLLPLSGSLGSISPEGNSGTQPVSTAENGTIKNTKKPGWLHSLLQAFGLGRSSTSSNGSRKPSGSDDLEWTSVERWGADGSGQPPTSSGSTSKPTPITDTFTVDEQDSRDPHLLSHDSETIRGRQVNSFKRTDKNWLSSSPADFDEGDKPKAGPNVHDSSSSLHASWNSNSGQTDERLSNQAHHDGLWVTIEPTNMSTSPFFDTLLVLVVSPLVTLTVVYALLLLRARIRRRRWRAPKSVVERLPVRTYHTVSDSPPSTATAVPSASSSPTTTTPLLQRTPSRPTSSVSRPQLGITSQSPTSSSSFQQGGRTPEEEKRDAGLAEWRRRYGGRQKECVVCLDEYEDGVSQVMSLPCGHEFHVDCITPWLVTRRRTCPICKGDVVASLSQSFRDRTHPPSPVRSPRFFEDDPDPLQAQAAETRNESPSASRPVPISSSSDLYDDYSNDLEANWADDELSDENSRARDIPRDNTFDISSSVRGLSSTVQTTIWRGVEAIRSASGLQRRTSQEELDRDR